MPEGPMIAEVARVVHYLKKHAVGKTIASVMAQTDHRVYDSVGTRATAFKNAMTGKKIVGARQHGQYFWLVMDSQPHPLMHLGSAGMIRFSNDDNAHYPPKKVQDWRWPPVNWKFALEMHENDGIKLAFVDPIRAARIRLMYVAANRMRNSTPLRENGPDPVLEKNILTVHYLKRKLLSKKNIPVKLVILDQANISGISNWLADEIMYQAGLHPEQYSHTLDDERIQLLHQCIMDVCDTAVSIQAEYDLIPDDWLMYHRRDKGGGDANTLPNGEKIAFLTVRGRTSAIVESRQKKFKAMANGEELEAIRREEELEAIKRVEELQAIKKKEEEEAIKREEEEKARALEESSEDNKALPWQPKRRMRTHRTIKYYVKDRPGRKQRLKAFHARRKAGLL